MQQRRDEDVRGAAHKNRFVKQDKASYKANGA